MSSSDESLVRPEIWSAARRYFDDQDWDKAIFDAFKKVESLTQQQIGSSAIGNPLFSQAFDANNSQRIVVAHEPKDLASLTSLFGGAVGLYKGDRSHGDEPAVKVTSREECLRVLIVACALLDILDRDEARAPKVLSVHRDGVNTLELRVDRLTPTTRILVNGEEARILQSKPTVAPIKLPSGLDGEISIIPIDGLKTGKEFKYELTQLPPHGNWHRVERIEIDLYASKDTTGVLLAKAILIRSDESGRQFIRALPTRQTYAVGDYTTWEWDSSGGIGESWLCVNGQVELAWAGSAYFAGRVIGHAGKERRVSIGLRPAAPLLGDGQRLPLRVTALYTDGTATWSVDETSQASIESDDKSIALIAGNQEPTLIAKSNGKTDLEALLDIHHSRAQVSVAPSFKGRVSEFLGGYQRITKLAAAPDGVLVANQGNCIYKLTASMRFGPVVKVDVPESSPYGVDYLAVAENGDIYYRAIWDTSKPLRKLIASNSYGREERATLPSGLTAMNVGWTKQTGALIADHVGGLWTWTGGNSDPVPWATLAGVCMDIQRIPSGVAALINTSAILELDSSGTATTTIRLDDLHGKGVSAIAKVDDTYFIACFNSGEVYEWAAATLRLLASGFNAPDSLHVLSPGRLLVANFGGDSISEVSI